MFPVLDRYQQEAYWSLMKIARQHGGAFLCDGVGLGKTFVGLMLIERLDPARGQARRPVRAEGGEGGGLGTASDASGSATSAAVGDFSNLAVFSHTDLGRKGDYPERFARIAELADAVIIDEAHHFRNPGRAGESASGTRVALPQAVQAARRLERDQSRLPAHGHADQQPAHRLPAHDRAVLARRARTTSHARSASTTCGRTSATSRRSCARSSTVTTVTETEVVVEARRSSRRARPSRSWSSSAAGPTRRRARSARTGSAAAFPERKPPQVADYSIGRPTASCSTTSRRRSRRASRSSASRSTTRLPTTGAPDDSIDPIENNRQNQVVGLIRTNFLKRFESSVWAFEQSCDRLLEKLLAFVEVHSETDAEKRRLERWKLQNADILGYAAQLTLDLDGEEDDEADEDVVPPSCSTRSRSSTRSEYKVDEILDETFLDLDQIVRFLAETRKFEPQHDDKLQKLIRLLKSKELAGRKVLIFSEFADTARYIAKHLARRASTASRSSTAAARRTAPT